MRRRPPLSLFLISSALMCCCALLIRAQGRQYTLFGDVRIEESESLKTRPQTFQIILRDLRGNVLGRQTVSSRSRYRFFNLPSGEYTLSVEAENRLVAQMSVLMQGLSTSEVRRDIDLQRNRSIRSEGEKARRVAMGSSVYARHRKAQQRFEKAQQEIESEDLGEAEALLEGLVSDDPGDFEAWTELGTLYFWRGALDEGDRAYRKALELRPDFLPALANLGKLQIAGKGFSEAIPNLQAALRQDPENADLHFLLGEAYLQIQKGSLAVESLREALRLDPVGQADAHLRMATLYDRAGLTDRAVREYQEYLKKVPQSPRRQELEEYIAKHEIR